MSLSTHDTLANNHQQPNDYAVPSKGTSTTSIETRTDLSILYRILRLCIRPLRPRLVALKPLNQTGSPQIVKHPTSHYGVTISERLVQIPATETNQLTQADSATNSQKLWLYDYTPKSISDDSKGSKLDHWWIHTIYYFAGGGFQAPASAEHWKLTARLAKDLAPHRVRVVMVSYPLAPYSPAKDSLPLLRAWLAQTLAETTDTPQTLSLMGDSAGGNVVLSLAFWWSTLLSRMTHEIDSNPKDISSWKHLTHIFTLSPPCDFRDTNPKIADADKLDPVMDASVTRGAGESWCKDWETSPLTSSDTQHFPAKSDPALSPNLHSDEAWTALRESGVVVDGVIGTADRLAPDAMVFMGKCVEKDVKGAWLVWEGQMHCFPLTSCYGVKEGVQGYEWLRGRVEGMLKR